MQSLDPQIQIILIVALAMLLGALLGFERELADKPAGLRTHMLVAGAAALLVSLSDAVITAFTDDVGSSLIRADPIRIVEAVITGVSFLGAGTIIHKGRNREYVEGLTTAASVLFAAAIGIAVALHQIIVAIGLSILVLIVLRGLRGLETRLGIRHHTEDDDSQT